MNRKIFYTGIAGINFRATENDLGKFLGYVKQDPTNEYDSRAVAVRKINGDIIGFISSDSLDKFYNIFNEITPDTAYVCFGNIKIVNKGNKTFYVGNIGVINSNDENEITDIINKNIDEDFDLYGQTI